MALVVEQVDSPWTYLLGATGLIGQTFISWGRTEPSATIVPGKQPHYIPWQEAFGDLFAIVGLVLTGIVIIETWIQDNEIDDNRRVTPPAGTALGTIALGLALVIAIMYPPNSVYQIYLGGYLLGVSGAILCIGGEVHYLTAGTWSVDRVVIPVLTLTIILGFVALTRESVLAFIGSIAVLLVWLPTVHYAHTNFGTTVQSE